ncbi:MAG: metallophosphoesterase [bacterium]|nr:metallophosphoesterase [bacterium]
MLMPASSKIFLGLTAALGLWSVWYEPNNPEVTHTEIYLDIPPAFDGLKAVLISDTHAGGWARSSYYAKAVRMIRKEAPDVLFLGGDIVTSHADDCWTEDLAPFASLKPAFGKIAVMGGHDRRFNENAVRQGIKSLGFCLLENEAKALEKSGQRLWIAGLKDNSDWPFLDDIDIALENVPAHDSRIILAHSPDAIFNTCQKNAQLLLCGHTHAGQVRLPWFGAILRVTDLPKKYDHGLSQFGATQLYVTRGLGSTVKLRLCCRPEISVIVLHSKSKE